MESLHKNETWELTATGDEMESLHKNETWELVPKPPGRKIVTCKWVYKKKEGMTYTKEVVRCT